MSKLNPALSVLLCRLNPLFVGTGSVLKCNTRLLSGSSMDAHSILLEHTLVMAGEVVDCGSVWQGWPSKSQISLTKYRAQVRLFLDYFLWIFSPSRGALVVYLGFHFSDSCVDHVSDLFSL